MQILAYQAESINNIIKNHISQAYFENDKHMQTVLSNYAQQEKKNKNKTNCV